MEFFEKCQSIEELQIARNDLMSAINAAYAEKRAELAQKPATFRKAEKFADLPDERPRPALYVAFPMSQERVAFNEILIDPVGGVAF